MSAYMIAQLNVRDEKTFEEYRAQVPETIAAYCGKYVVRGGPIDVLEGDYPYSRVVVIEFPTTEKARAWHASAMYEGPKALRQKASDGLLILVEGYDG
jgi:uncharacterized protein (DUF1330 family)